MASDIERLTSVLVDRPADSPQEVSRRCQAADALAALGPAAGEAVPALLRTLVVPVTVDCALALRVAAAAALWQITREWTLAVPILTWALKDEYWGDAPRAIKILAEIGHPGVVPDLIQLAQRRLSHGPFDFDKFPYVPDIGDSKPLLAAVADALGTCANKPRFRLFVPRCPSRCGTAAPWNRLDVESPTQICCSLPVACAGCAPPLVTAWLPPFQPTEPWQRFKTAGSSAASTIHPRQLAAPHRQGIAAFAAQW